MRSLLVDEHCKKSEKHERDRKKICHNNLWREIFAFDPNDKHEVNETMVQWIKSHFSLFVSRIIENEADFIGKIGNEKKNPHSSHL